jgi:hypothetical protein
VSASVAGRLSRDDPAPLAAHTIFMSTVSAHFLARIDWSSYQVFCLGSGTDSARLPLIAGVVLVHDSLRHRVGLRHPRWQLARLW